MYVKTPHLPEKAVKTVIIGKKYKQILEKPLQAMGISCIFMPEICDVEWQINSHADIGIIHIKDDIFVANPGMEIDLSYIDGAKKLNIDYPNNILYNGLLLGDKFFHQLECTDKNVLAELQNVSLHNVKQGFSKCSVCIVNENSAITSDVGMYKALKLQNIDTLLISTGHIDLDGYNYGFIGGCAFKSSKDTIVFTGSLENHPDKRKIFKFIASKNIQISYLTDEKIFDVGSILPIFY